MCARVCDFNSRIFDVVFLFIASSRTKCLLTGMIINGSNIQSKREYYNRFRTNSWNTMSSANTRLHKANETRNRRSFVNDTSKHNIKLIIQKQYVGFWMCVYVFILNCVNIAACWNIWTISYDERILFFSKQFNLNRNVHNICSLNWVPIFVQTVR